MLEYMSKEESLYILEQSREKYEWDVANRIQSARDEGRSEGRSEGIAEGRSEGIAEGEMRGERESALRVAGAALSRGMDISLITDITGLDADTIRRLKEN
jgi:predicted transposase YdaD